MSTTSPAETPETPETPDARGGGWRRFLARRSATGALLALGAFLVSFSPSLLPRPWHLQAVAATLSAVAAYPIGAAIGWLTRLLARPLGVRIAVDRPRRRVPWSLAAAAVVGLAVLAWVAGHQGRVRTAQLVGLTPPTWLDDARALGAGVALCLVVVLVTWAVKTAYRASRFVLSYAVPRPLAGAVAGVLVVALGAWLTTSVAAARVLESISRAAAAADASTPQGRVAPTSPLRTGGPGSEQTWADLGFYGQRFTTGAPSAADIEAVRGGPAIEPIRVYASPNGDPDPDVVADRVVAELRRTGAFDRAVLTVIHTTGRGWVDEHNVRAVEYLTDGDCATAAMQYSFLPSPVAFVTDRTVAERAGRALFTKVYAAWSALPPASRPRLYLSGESLGAFGGQAAFPDARAMLDAVDGAVWVGTPSSTALWQAITAERQPGSPQVAPVVEHGAQIRFATRPADLRNDVYGRPLGPWGTPRVVYLQHASDPVAWWSPSLLWSEPDWIGERAGPDVDRSMRWWPVVTFWMVTIDLAVGDATTAGHGHIYEDDMLDAWAGSSTSTWAPTCGPGSSRTCAADPSPAPIAASRGRRALR